jgi:NTE family protein
VLGGGGVTGIAWEIGVLAGLMAAGVDLRDADVTIGSSAGAFVGVAYTSGHDIEASYAEQLDPDTSETLASASPATLAAWVEAFTIGGNDRRRIGVELGKLARSGSELVSPQARRAVVEARLTTLEWPAGLSVTAIDADTGGLHAFDASSGISLIDAVSASGAVPGVWPLQRINGRDWIDGGMVSSTNAHLAQGHDRVLVLAPMPWSFGAVPGAAEDVEALGQRGRAVLLAPDAQSIEAIGPNPYDPARRPPAARSGREQGRRSAAEVVALWQG